MATMLSTKEVAAYLGVNEKMVYTLVSEKGLPATKITGKWLFPKHLVDQWVEMHTVNYPETPAKLLPDSGLLVIVGSNDPLLDQAISLFNQKQADYITVFGNMGSMGGLNSLRQNLCHMASSHLLEEDDNEYNFSFAGKELDRMPAVVNFSRREQGILIRKGNPRKIASVADLKKPGIRIVNRSLRTGTRLLFDRELKKAGIKGEKIKGYDFEVSRHLDVGLAILTGHADAGPGIRPVAAMLDLEFIPIRWERFDLLIPKDHFFHKGVQSFIGLLHEEAFTALADNFKGYDLSLSGKMLFPA